MPAPLSFNIVQSPTESMVSNAVLSAQRMIKIYIDIDGINQFLDEIERVLLQPDRGMTQEDREHRDVSIRAMNVIPTVLRICSNIWVPV